MIFQSSGFSRGRAISSPCVLKLDVFNFNRYIVFKYHHGNQFLTVKLLVSPPDGVLGLPDLYLSFRDTSAWFQTRAILKYILDGSLHLFSQFAQCRVTLTQSIHSFKNLESRLLGINSCQLWKDAEEDAQGLFLICERNIPCQPFRGLSATHVFAQRMPIRWF